MGIKVKIFLGTALFFLISCSSSFLKLDKKDDEFKKNKEFEEKVVIKEIKEIKEIKDSTPPSQALESTKSNANSNTLPVLKSSDKEKAALDLTGAKAKKKRNQLNSKSEKPNKAESDLTPVKVPETSIPEIPKREPDLEDLEGFSGRRPLIDPFRVGEEVVHDVHYFKVSAGELFLRVEPFVEVNGKKAYTFTTEIKSSSMFSTFYSAQDKSVTYVDYFDLVPHVFTLSVQETGQLKDAKGLIDIQKNMATYWEKKFTKKSGQEEKKLEWEVLPFSQNVYSAAYYMRLFKWEVGKEYAFRVADQGENLVFRGKALRKEKLETDIGEFDTIVVKPEITVKGVFRPIGDIFFWLSDDDRKFILRIESNIKIGTIVSEVIRLNKGQL